MSATTPTAPADPAVRLDVRPDRVAVLTLDQPGGRANLLTLALWQELDAALAPLAGRPDLRGLVVASGKPGHFVAGADLKFLAGLPGPNDPAARELVETGLRVLARLESLPFPTCAAIDGPALGGGLEVALACDYRVAGTSEKVALGLPETTLGLIPGWGGTQRLQRVIGTTNAAAMIADGHTLDADHAMLAGLVDAVAESADLLDAAAKMVLTRKDWRAIRFHKEGSVTYDPKKSRPVDVPDEPGAVREALQVVAAGADLPLADAIRLETEAFLRLAGSDEAKQKIAEFFAAKKKTD